MPRILVIQADNTTAQTKNSKVATFLAWVVASGKFDAVVLNFLLVGHTHEDIDQFFSVLFFLLHRHRKWQSAKALLDALTPELRERFSARSENFYATPLTHIRDFQTWLSPIECKQYNCWNGRYGIETPHSFSYKRRRDLSAFDLKSGVPMQLWLSRASHRCPMLCQDVHAGHQAPRSTSDGDEWQHVAAGDHSSAYGPCGSEGMGQG